MIKALAQVNIGDQFKLGDKPGSPAIAGVPALQSIGGFVSSVLPNIYVIAGIILFVLLLVSGLLFIISAGKGDEEAAKKYQKTITASLIGFLIIFGSYWIMEIIRTVTGIEILTGGGL